MSGQVSSLSLGQLVSLTGGVLTGDESHSVEGVSTLHNADARHVAALTNSRYLNDIQTSQAGCVILREDDAPMVTGNRIVHPDPALAFALVSRYFHPQPTIRPGIASSAVIDHTATVAESASIGSHCTIGAHAVIGEHVSVGPGCVILDNVKIGQASRLIANVTLCEDVEIGSRCLLYPGAVVGSDGFGYVNNGGEWLKVPQTGRVLIGDDVEIGANTTIDRGSLRDTMIGTGVKLDNQIQIAHNVVIGEHTAIAALVGIAGSTSIGSHCTIGGEAGVIGHLQIGDRCHIAAQTLVTRSLPDGSQVTGGVPAVESGLWRKMIARLRRIELLAERVATLEKMRKN